MNYIQKSFDAVVKDLDVKKGIVEGYFNTWGIVDADNDELVPGAFTKTIQENGPDAARPRIYHLLQHSTKHPLHRFVETGTIKEDNRGLYFRSKITPTSYGRDTLLLYDDGVINEHSVGIMPIKTNKADDGHNRITEVKLWEGSTVTWGSNLDTPTISVKGLNNKEIAEKYNNRIDLLTKSLRDGAYTDETFVLLELQLKQIQAHYVALLEKAQPEHTEPQPKEPPKKVTLEIRL